MRRRSIQIVLTLAIALWGAVWMAVAISAQRQADAYMHAAGDYYFKANGAGVSEQQGERYIALSLDSDRKMARSAWASTAAGLIGLTPTALAIAVASYRIWRARRRKPMATDRPL